MNNETNKADTTTVDEHPYKCPHCDHEPFKSNSGLRYHSFKEHGMGATNLGDAVCPEPDCGYRSSPQGVRLHMSLRHGIKGAWSKRRARILRQHKYAGKGGKLGCSYCDFTSGTKSGMTRHMRNQHANETGYAMIGKPTTRTLTDRLKQHLAEPSRVNNTEPMMDKVLAMVAEKIYNKLMEGL